MALSEEQWFQSIAEGEHAPLHDWLAVSHNEDGTPNGGYQPDVTADRPTGVAATDTAALQAAIDDTPVGGFCLIPGDKTDKTVPYLLSSALTIGKHIRVEGLSLVETYASEASGGGPGGPVSPYLAGTVLEQTTAGANVIEATATGKSIHLANLGLKFATAIAGSDTGHGLYGVPSTAYSLGGTEMGLAGFTIRNVHVVGLDGDHYGFVLLNPIEGLVQHCHAYGGGGWWIYSDGFDRHYGNLVLEDIYTQITNSGTADGIRLDSNGTDATSLNLITMVRPQVNGSTGTQMAFTATKGTHIPQSVLVIAPDFEGINASQVDFGGPASGVVAYTKGGFLPIPAAGYDSETGYISYTTAGTYMFVVPNGVSRLRVRVIGAGGGGGGGGSNSAAAANAGGGGGGAGGWTEATMTVTPLGSITVVVGAGGAGGTGGASGGNAGSGGAGGGQSSFNGNVLKATGGHVGGNGPASSSTAQAGGGYSGAGASTTVGLPGYGAPSAQTAVPMAPGIVGGGGGGASNTTKGGGGGAASAGTRANAGVSPGSTGAGADANGVAGTAAVTAGCGGGGGGGAPSGGAGGDGGAGADGSVEVWW